MNNGQKSLSINETFIVEGDYDGIISACTGLYTSAIISCFGNTQINMGTDIISTLSSFSAATYYGDGSNLTGVSKQDTYVTGGTYNDTTGVATFTNNTGGTFSVTGFYTGATDVYITAVTFTNNLLTLHRNDGVTLGATIDDFVSLNVNGPISATTYYGDGSNLTGISTQDTVVTGGTYSAGTAVFTNNTGGTFNVTGFYTGATDVYVTGATKLNDVATFVNNTGGTFTLTGLTDTVFTGGTVVGPTYFTNGVTASTLSASTIYSNLGLNINDNLGNQSNYNAGYFDIYPSDGGVITNFGSTLLWVGNDTYGVSSQLEPTLLQFQTPENLTQYTESGVYTQSSASTLNSFLYPTKPNNYIGTFAMSDDLTNVVNLVTVGLSGSTGVDFNSIKEAVDSITGASATNTYVVKVGPGVFYEDQITMKSYVDVVGESATNTIIQANDPNASLIIGADQSMINNVQIQGCTGTSVAAVYYSSPTTPQLNAIFYVENVRFGANYTHAKTVGTAGGNCIMQCSNVKYGGYPFTLGFYVTNDGSGIGRMQLRNVTSTNGGVTTTSGLVFAKADQPGCAFIVNGALLTKSVGAPAGVGFWIENGGVLRATSVNLQRWSTGIYAPQVGSAPSIDGLALNFEGCTIDVNIIHSGATGKLQGTDNYLKTLINIDAPLYEVNEDPRIITVAKKGGDFTSIKSAVDSITGSSSNNRFLVSVGPGKFIENEIDLTSKPYVSIQGSNIITTQIVPNTNTQHIFKIGQNNELSFLNLSGAPSGYAAIYVYDIGDYAQAHKISFNDCDTNVWVESETQDTVFYGEYLDFNGSYSYGTKIIANNGYLAYANMENYYNLPTGTGTTIGNRVQGSGATLSVFIGDGIGNGASGSTNYEIYDYASLNTISTTADNWDYGVRVLNIGGPSRFDIDSYSVVNSLIYDLSIEHPNTFGTFGGGSSTHNKIYNLSDNVYWGFLDTEDGEFEVTRKISVTFQDGTHTDLSTLIFEGGTMGLMDGGIITHVSGLTFEVSSGFGYLEKTVGDEIYMRIDWDDTQITLSPNSEHYLYFNENLILSSSGSAPDNTNNIILGRVVTDSSSVSFIDETPYNASHTSNLLSTFNRKALGPIYSNGSFVTENVTPYHLNVSAGDYYYSENNFTPSGGTDINFTQYYRDGSSGWITSATTEVVNGYDDNSGFISPLPLSSFTKHTLYVVGDGLNEKYMLVLGQTYYTTLVEAEGADLPTPPSYFDDGVTSIASIYIQQGFSGITEIQDIRPIIGFKAAGVSATAVHGNLLGLNADDHTQYLLVDGARAMTGNLSMNGNAIVSAVTVNGVTVESHASRHKNGGADEIATATPAPSEIPKADTFGKLDSWISDASSSVKGLTNLSVDPLVSTTPIAVGENDSRFLSSITGASYSAGTAVFTNNSGGTISVSGFSNDLSETFYDSYIGTRLTPKNSSINGFAITSSANAQLGFRTRNTDISGNGAISSVSVGGDGGLYENTLGVQFFGKNYYVPYLRNTGGLYSTNDLNVININNSKIDFRIGSTFGTETSRLLISTGGTLNTGNFSATTISATTYQNLPIDIRVTGGTFSGTTAIFTNNTGGTFTVTGFTSSSTFTGGTVSGATNFTNGVTATTISASTYLNLPSLGGSIQTSGSTLYSTSPNTSNFNIGNSIFFGKDAGYGATAANNSNFLGFQAGYGATSAADSNFLGSSAGFNAIDAQYSNFLGTSAGQNATSASGSNFLGVQAGYNATNASDSNFLGLDAGFGSVNAAASNFIGYSAGYNATNSANSNFLGYNSGYAATDATNSNFMGNSAGYNSQFANDSNFFGQQAGYEATGADNSNFIGLAAGYQAAGAFASNFLGFQTGYQATAAFNSNFFGNAVGVNATDAHDSNFFGFQTGLYSSGASYSTFIGYNVGASISQAQSIGSNNVIIGTNISLPSGTTDSINIGGVLFGSGTYSNTSGSPSLSAQTNGKIGINVVNPQEALDVNGNAKISEGLTATTISATTYDNLPSGTTVGSFGITIDGAGSVITTGVKGYTVLPYNAIITGWDIVGNTIGDCVVDIWRGSSGTIPTLVDTITGTEKPTLSAQQINSDNNLTSWTTNVSLGDVIAFKVDSVSTVTRVNLIIKVIKI